MARKDNHVPAEGKVSRSALVAALDAVAPGLAAKEVASQATCFAFVSGRVWTYNGEVAASHASPVAVEGAVKAAELHKLLRRMTDEEVDVKVAGPELRVTGKRAKGGVPLLAEVTMPIESVGEIGEWFPLPVGFSAAVKAALFTAGSDMVRPELTAVHLAPGLVETCDNFRMTRVKVDGQTLEAMVPSDAMAEIIKYDPTHAHIGEAWVHFRNAADTVLSARLVSGTYPDLSPFAARKIASPLELPVDLADVLGRALVFLDDQRGSTGMASVTVADGRMSVRAEGEAGWFEERVRVAYDGEELSFMVSPALLAEMLGRAPRCGMDKDGTVIRFEGEGFLHICAVTAPEVRDEA